MNHIQRISAIVFVLMALFTNIVLAKNKTNPALSDAEIAFLPTHILAQKIKSGEISTSKVVKIYLSRIKRYNGKINAIVTLDEEGAIKRALEADRAFAQGEIWGPLHGVPITIKDNYKVKGIRSTAGYPPLKNNVPNEDSTIVKRLKDAGGIILGKTNMPQLGLDWQTFNPIFGVTNNPWDVTRTPGGSSGGCGAAVAAGLTSFSIGNDIGGSIRFPAHFNGIYGIKTTEGFVPESGLVREEGKSRTVRHLLTHGPLARSAEDLSLVLSIISGADGLDSEVPRIYHQPKKGKKLKEIKVAWIDHLEDAFVSDESQKIVQDFVKKLETAGVQAKRIHPKGFKIDEAVGVFKRLFLSEIGTETTWWERKIMCILGIMCPPTDIKSYFEILNDRDRIITKLEKFFDEWDAWVIPAGSYTAFKHRTPDDWLGPIPSYETPVMVGEHADESDVYTSIFNLTGHPAVIIPAGYSKEGMPIAVQVVGKRWYDMELLAIAEQLSKIGSAYKRPPGYE